MFGLELGVFLLVFLLELLAGLLDLLELTSDEGALLGGARPFALLEQLIALLECLRGKDKLRRGKE